MALEDVYVLSRQRLGDLLQAEGRTEPEAGSMEW